MSKHTHIVLRHHQHQRLPFRQHSNRQARLYLLPTPTLTSAADTVPPTISITSPQDGASVTGKTLTVSVTASDNVKVVGVKFYVDGVYKGKDTSVPYVYNISWRNVPSGAHTVTVVASDTANNTSQSSITIYK